MEDDLVLPCGLCPQDRVVVEWSAAGRVSLRIEVAGAEFADVILTPEDILRLVAFLNNPKD